MSSNPPKVTKPPRRLFSPVSARATQRSAHTHRDADPRCGPTPVFLYLAERPGVLVTKEEPLDAVWPGIAVTPDALTKSVGELRSVLGDESALPSPPYTWLA